VLQIGLLDGDGDDIPLTLSNMTASPGTSPLLMAPGSTAVLNTSQYNSNTTVSSSVILLVSQPGQTFSFELGAAGEPAALSLLRDFSAPVDVEGAAYEESGSVRFPAMYDSNPFARWGTAQGCAVELEYLTSRVAQCTCFLGLYCCREMCLLDSV
jgi:hypothetical protein